MAIEFRCTKCSKLLRIGDEAAGKQAKCPECGTVSAVPAAGAEPPLQRGSFGPAPPPSSGGEVTHDFTPEKPGPAPPPQSPYQAPQQPVQGPAINSGYSQGHLPNYLVQAILCTLFCCLPFGIVGIVYAAQVNGHLATGNYRAAQASSNSARMWC